MEEAGNGVEDRQFGGAQGAAEAATTAASVWKPRAGLVQRGSVPGQRSHSRQAVEVRELSSWLHLQ